MSGEYTGSERRKNHDHLICEQGERISNIERVQAGDHTAIDFLKYQSQETNDIVKELRTKLLTGNGHEAIVTVMDRRISTLESGIKAIRDALISRDELMLMLAVWKVGKAIGLAVLITVVVGGACALFYHLFHPTAPITTGVIAK